ncbi:MAG: FHA domain-containing protein [Deltaproteobacteria bacterium]|nr:MAG: FHA domain-containing protein [Deltaproteobacteria bacterium]TMQ17359.1 MAG: FHA domain-containing protein [Deltaproteobacteria bacterium]
MTVPLPASGELVIGRSAECGLRLSDELVSRAHAQLFVVPDGIRLEDLGSRHGTLLNGQRLTAPRLLASGDVVGIGSAVLIVHRRSRAASGRAMLDAACLLRRFEEELERSLRYRRELALVVVRSDRPFVRPRVAGVLAERLRLIDVAALFGEQELAVLVPESTAEDAAELARALTGALADTVAGVAASPADGVDVDTLFSCARMAAMSPSARPVACAADAVHVIDLDGQQALVADPAMIGIYELLRRLARSALPILILGETGVGKELAAAAAHRFSPRAGGPFVSINCASIPEQLAESELFGHERGAFTGAAAAKPGQLELAHGGTVFLDEVGELPPAVQAKLLRVLEAGELQRVGDVKPRPIDVRIVAATNRDLAAEIAAGGFRQDLFFRLAAAQVVIPPLRDRPRDLAVLIQRLFAAACARLGRPPLALTIAVTQALLLHRWPGNVRELRNTLEYAAAAAPEIAVEVDVWHLPPALARLVRDLPRPAEPPVSTPRSSAQVAAVAPDGGRFRPIDDELRELERERMVAALAATGGVQNRAAELIAMPLRTFVTKLKRYAIDAIEWR